MEYRADLDGLRGLAVLLVVLFHAGLPQVSGGFVGVDVFFVLSGYLITSIILRDLGREAFSIAGFYERRVRRLLPALSVVLLACALLSLYVATPFELKLFGKSLLTAALFCSNFLFSNTAGYFQPRAETFALLHTWSLAIEEQFYLVWPLLVFLLGALRMKLVCVACLVLSPLFRAWMLLRGTDPLYGGETTIIDVYVLTPGRLEGLALGALIALHLRGKPVENAPPDDPGPGIRLARLVPIAKIVAPVCLLASVAFEGTRFLSDHKVHSHTAWTAYAGYTVVAIGFAAVLVLALAARPGSLWHRFWTFKPLRSFGKYSYAIYLVHMPVRAVIRDLIYGPNFNGSRFGDAIVTFPKIGDSELLGQVLFFIPAFGACWIVGWLSWNLFEKHFLKLKKHFPYDGHKG